MAASTALLTSLLLSLAAACAVLAVRPPAASRLGRRRGPAGASTRSVLHVAGGGKVMCNGGQQSHLIHSGHMRQALAGAAVQ